MAKLLQKLFSSIGSAINTIDTRIENDALELQQQSETVGWLSTDGWNSSAGSDYERWNYVWSRVLTQSGVRVNGRVGLTTSAFWACAKMIAEDIAKLQINMCLLDSIGNKQKKNNHWLYPVISISPDGQIRAQKFWETMILWTLTWGDGIALIGTRDPNNGQITSMELIHPNRVDIRVEDGVRTYYIYPNETDRASNRNGQPYPANRIYHLDGIGDKWSGYPIATFARESLGITLSLQELQSSLFANGLNLGGVLKTEQKLDKEVRRAMSQEWTATYGGAANNGKVPVLDQALKYDQFDTKAVDSEVLESRKFQILEIARFFRVPPHKLGILDAATMNNMEQENKSYFNDTLSPWINRIEKETQFKLIPMSSRFFMSFDTKPLTMADTKSKVDFMEAMIKNGAATPNMMAQEFDYPTYEGGDKYYIQANNLQPIDKAQIDMEKSQEELKQLREPANRDPQVNDEEQSGTEEISQDEQANIEVNATEEKEISQSIDILSYKAFIESAIKPVIAKEIKFIEGKQDQLNKFGDDFNYEQFKEKEDKFYNKQKDYMYDCLSVFFEQVNIPNVESFINKWHDWQGEDKAKHISSDYILQYLGLYDMPDGTVIECEQNGRKFEIWLNDGVIECL